MKISEDKTLIEELREEILSMEMPKLTSLDDWKEAFETHKRSKEVTNNMKELGEATSDTIVNTTKAIIGEESEPKENIHIVFKNKINKSLMSTFSGSQERYVLIRVAKMNVTLPKFRKFFLDKIKKNEELSLDDLKYYAKRISEIDEAIEDIHKNNPITELDLDIFTPFVMLPSLMQLNDNTLNKYINAINKSYSNRIYNERKEYFLSDGGKEFVGRKDNLIFHKKLVNHISQYLKHNSDETNEEKEHMMMAMIGIILTAYHGIVLQAKKDNKSFDGIMDTNFHQLHKNIIVNHQLLETNFINTTVGFNRDNLYRHLEKAIKEHLFK